MVMAKEKSILWRSKRERQMFSYKFRVKALFRFKILYVASLGLF